MTGFRINTKGFSYVELLIATTLMAAALAPILQSLATPWVSSSEENYLILNTSRDRMEEILSMDFSAIAVGSSLSDTVTIGGTSIPRAVTVALYDLNGDTVPESDVKKITVDVEQVLLEALKVLP